MRNSVKKIATHNSNMRAKDYMHLQRDKAAADPIAENRQGSINSLDICQEINNVSVCEVLPSSNATLDLCLLNTEQ